MTRSAFAPLLSGVSPLWALTNTVARFFLKSSAKRLPCKVISVGNIVAGGVGKTEIAGVIAARLIARGKRVVVASRGYGSKWQSEGAIALDLENARSLAFPDEALLLLQKVPGLAVAVGAKRHAVLTRNWEELRPDVVILDDGLQHFEIARDLDVLVHDFSVRWPVLRELPRMLVRAPVRVALSEVPERWRSGGTTPWIRARYDLKGMVDAHGRQSALPSDAIAFCGLGNPQRFKRALTQAGVRLNGFKTFADHARYGLSEAKDLARWQQEAKLPMLTTLKDYVKLSALIGSQGGVAGFEPAWVQVKVEFLENESVLWGAIDEALAIGPS